MYFSALRTSNSSPCGGTWCLRLVLGPSGPYSVGQWKPAIWFPMVKLGGSVFKNFEIRRLQVGRSAKITVSIHWTLLSNFHFLAHFQIMHCYKYILHIYFHYP